MFRLRQISGTKTISSGYVNNRDETDMSQGIFFFIYS